ncbi:hypothetical protein ACFPZ0_19405 [Streptomonospora nanhaiensis]|uniref:Potassium ABC transporter ATPase n=1 Tax=Streptomonospora nanhaiensis TaxID=1323731 RepID=A0A853BMM1_9ACTN|nr:hypothetical protein [Streptomonospora nanhaiensis]MBV2365358.1 hypothetical protein [Streptomonospora nanhaiensis]MBX9389628.1 hypothetical protein [Streptomonospora nanhaiensis]NYI95955.1 hypothetical protein [Streptomonospora nanhaiensis]
MADIVFVLVAVAFFALCVGYVRGCERIIGADPADSAARNLSADRSGASGARGEAVAP